tara:strand:+ start:2840 stop:3562 length:723 start_codon:yes stop_codon:yes gene_type:complete
MARTDDMPAASPLAGRVTLDEESNFFIKDPNIPESYVVVEKSAQNKTTYVPTDIGTPHPTLVLYFLYEESVRDIGNGIFEIDSKYAIVPPTWYSFEAQNIPFTKFVGVSVTGSGAIVITESYKFAWLNLQGIEDVRDFNENVYASTEQKQGSINCVVRIKHEYAAATLASIKDGTLAPFTIATAGYEANTLNGTLGNIDDDMTFTFTTADPSDPIKFEAGKYIGNIYYNKKFEIVSAFVV